MKRLLLILATALSAAACIYPFSTDTEGQVPRSLVVDGNILIGTVSTFHLRYLQPLSAATFEMAGDVPSGNIWLEDDHETVYHCTAVSGSPGEFAIDLTSAPKTYQYKLHIDINDNGRHYQTPWLDVHKAPVISDISFSAEEKQIVVKCTLEPEAGEPLRFLMDFEEDWETMAKYWQSYDFIIDSHSAQGGYYVEKTDNPHYYCWKKASSKRSSLASTEERTDQVLRNHIFYSFSRYDVRTKIQYALMLKVRGVSVEGYDFTKMLSSNSDVTGSLFSPVPSEMRGNITCDEDPSEMVYGFIDAATVRERRVFLDSRYYLADDPYDERFVPDLEDMTLDWYYIYGNRPVGYAAGGDMLWAPLRCVDCVEDGGTKNKPSYWPNSHE